MRNDYKNTNGLVTGVRALLKKEGIEVGHWFQSGRIKSISHFSGGIEVKGNWDEVVINNHHGKRIPLEKVMEVLDRNGVEYELNKLHYGQNITIKAEKYCLSVR